LQWKDFGAFFRFRAFYDFAYIDDNSHDSPGTNNAFRAGKISDPQKWSTRTKDRHGRENEILDAFAYCQFNLGAHEAELRVGSMVASWGESLFVFNSVSTAMAPLDARFATVPGAELRDLFLPTQQVFGSIGITDTLTLAGYYQWEWAKTRLPEAGFFLPLNNAFADAIDDSGYTLITPGFLINRTKDTDPEDDGQYGFALRWICDALNASEFGFYYINYHEKLPKLNFDLMPMLLGIGFPTYNLSYQEDVKLYGFSVGTELWDINWGLEMTYRTDMPAAVIHSGLAAAGVPNPLNVVWDTADVFQAQLSFSAFFNQIMFADRWTILGEVGYNTVNPDGSFPLNNDKDAWGGTVKVTPLFEGVLPYLDVEFPITVKLNPSGVSSVQATFTENEDSISIGADFTYRALYQVGLVYTNFLGDPEDNRLTDRDFVAINFKYAF
ncbi:MAG: DUF1302 family protein, partial [Deltaproteobacteria bacterium]|nr:DUF1302 family protein [Deltaproteobacteria bacterium]